MIALLLLVLLCAGVKSARAARAAFRPQQGRRQLTVVAAAEGKHPAVSNVYAQCIHLTIAAAPHTKPAWHFGTASVPNAV